MNRASRLDAAALRTTTATPVDWPRSASPAELLAVRDHAELAVAALAGAELRRRYDDGEPVR